MRYERDGKGLNTRNKDERAENLENGCPSLGLDDFDKEPVMESLDKRGWLCHTIVLTGGKPLDIRGGDIAVPHASAKADNTLGCHVSAALQ